MPKTKGKFTHDSLTMVRQFHEAFGCRVEESPKIPPMNLFSGNMSFRMDMIKADVQEAADHALYCAQNTNGDRADMFLRLQLILEETAELIQALNDADLVEVADALGDLQYVLDGTFLCFGLGDHKSRIVREIHRSNMTKLVDGEPLVNEAGRVVKPDHWDPPDLEFVLEEDDE